MRFIKEITLFAPSGTLKRFQGLETDFKVEQGKISALISESELTELRNGNKTMYSRLYSAEQTVSGLDELYTEVSGKYDTVSGQYTDLESKTAEYKESVDGFSANLTQLSNHVRDDYSTTESMQAYVKASIGGFESTVSKTYVTTEAYGNGITDAKKYADTQASGALSSAKSYADDAASGVLEDAQSDAASKANAALEDAKTDTNEKLKSYSTTTQMNTAINQKAQAIELSVSKTYATTKQFDNYKENMGKLVQARIDAKADSIQAWVEDTSFQDSCTNGDFSDGIHYWTDGGYKGGTTISTDEEYGKYAAISAGYIIGQEIAAGPQRLTITFDAKTMMSSGSQVTIEATEAGSQVYDLEYNKWEHFSITIENLSTDKKHTITFKASKNLCNVCITNIKFLENASDFAAARIQVFADRISSTVQKGSVISEINQTAEGVKISAAKINFNGLVTANERFKILTDGSFEASYGKMGGWTVKDGVIKSNDQKLTLDPKNNKIYFDTGDDDYVTELSPDGTRTNYLTVDGGVLGNPALLIDAAASSHIQFYDSFSDDGDDIITLQGDLKVYGTKSRVAQTENFSDRLLYCYETPTPMFGDIGCGTTNDRGIAIIDIDPAFSETINSGIEYQVFLQKEGDGDIWVAEKDTEFFMVQGTPNLKFSWEVKCIQRSFEHLRLDEKEVQEAAQKDVRDTQKDYDIIIDTIVEDYDKEMEELINESN